MTKTKNNIVVGYEINKFKLEPLYENGECIGLNVNAELKRKLEFINTTITICKSMNTITEKDEQPDTTADCGFITELNCFRWLEDAGLEKEYFGIRIEPTKDPKEATERAKNENDYRGDVWACGVYIDGKRYGDGEYKSLEEIGIDKEYILL